MQSMQIIKTPHDQLITLIEQAKKTGKKMPVVFDTDIGHDPDDWNALISILSDLVNNQHIDLKAVVTTGEFTDIKAKLVKAGLKILGREDIHVYAGAGLHLKDITLLNGKHPKTLEEALKLPVEKQIEYLEKKYPTYPGDLFKGFYPFQGRAWEELNYQECEAEGDIVDAVAFIKQLVKENINNIPKDEPNVLVVSTGELSNIAKYYEAGLTKRLLVQHMGGWSGQDNSLGQENIFPRGYLGRNTVADIIAAENVFNNKDAYIILYMSHLKEQFNLKYSGDVRKLLCLVDQFPINELSDDKLISLLIMLEKDLSEPDRKLETIPKEIKIIQQLREKDEKNERNAIKQLYSIEKIKELISTLLPTAGVTTLPYADQLGRAMARDFANWLAQTSFPYIICSDPGTFITAIHPSLVNKTKNVGIVINANLAQVKHDKFKRSSFTDSVITTENGNISAITGLKNRECIMQPILNGLLTHIYPGVTYDQFMTIAEEKIKLSEKINKLNSKVLKYQLHHSETNQLLPSFNKQEVKESKINCQFNLFQPKNVIEINQQGNNNSVEYHDNLKGNLNI